MAEKKKSPFKFFQASKRSNNKVIKVSSLDEAKMVLQSYVLTTAKYDFSVYEKRILYYCVVEAQKHLQGLKLGREIDINRIIGSPDEVITMPTSSILVGEDDKNYAQVKSALYSLLGKKIVYQDHEVWTAFTVVQSPKVLSRGIVSFTVNPLLWQCILDFSRGFHAYELQVAMRFTSVYSMRFYEFVSNPQNDFDPEVSIDTIKEWFGLENKYSDNSMFVKRVVEAAQKDLDKYAPWSFDFELVKEGRRIARIKIIPRRCPENGDRLLQAKVLRRRTDFSWEIPDRDTRLFLRDVVGFSMVELNNNRALWHDAYVRLGNALRGKIQEIYARGRELEKQKLLHTSVKAYVVGAVRSIVDDLAGEQSDPVAAGARQVADKLRADR